MLEPSSALRALLLLAGASLAGCAPPQPPKDEGRPNPAPVEAAPRFHRGSLALSFFYSCALTDDGHVGCWGMKGGPTKAAPDDRTAGVERIAGLSGAVELTASSNDVCARLADESIWCWKPKEAPKKRAVEVPAPVQIGAGLLSVCALSKAGGVACVTGDGVKSAPAIEGAVELRTSWAWPTILARKPAGTLWHSDGKRAFRRFEGLSGVAELATGQQDCVRTEKGAVRCLDLSGETPKLLEPGTVPAALPAARQVTTGQEWGCALTPSDEVRCWHGESGLEPFCISAETSAAFGRDRPICSGPGPYPNMGIRAGQPVPVVKLERPVEIVAGGYHLCARRADGAVLCWGDNTYGESDPDDPGLRSGKDPSSPFVVRPTVVRGLGAQGRSG